MIQMVQTVTEIYDNGSKNRQGKNIQVRDNDDCGQQRSSSEIRPERTSHGT